MYRQSEKNLLNSSISPTCYHNMVNIGPLAAEIGSLVWAPQQISTGFASWLQYCTNVAERRSTKLCMTFCHLIYICFWGLLPPNGISSGAKFAAYKCCVLWHLKHYCTLAVGVSQTLRHSAEGATYIRQGVHALGISPRSSLLRILFVY